MTRLLRLLGAAIVAAIAVAACSSSNGGSAATPPASSGGAATSSAAGGSSTGSGQAEAAATITIASFAFGAPVTVPPGATVTVKNTDGAAHNVTADDGSFKTSDLNQGESGTFTAPTKPGTYKFSCTLHASMKSIGTLTVQ